MSDLLDKIDAALEEVEERLLAELGRCRTLNPDADYCVLEHELKNKLLNMVIELDRRLENSGDKKRLELRTERHEVIHARIVTARQVLESDIPVAYLHQVHEEIKHSRDRLETRALARRKKLEPEVTMGQRRDRTDSLKTLFTRNINEKELNRNRYLITEEEERELEDLDEMDEFLDSGIYSASRELAMLANLIHRGATNKPRPEQPKGRAVFEAKELKTTIPPVSKVKPTREPEPEPELEPTQQARDKEQQEKKSDIARTPEEIRRKLEERKYQSSGPSSFGAKDIEPEQPQEFYGRKPSDSEEDKKEPGDEGTKEDKEEDKPASQKAIFESRDVSRSPWDKD